MDSPQDIDQYYRKQYKIYDATRSSFLFGRNKLAQLVNQDLNENDKTKRGWYNAYKAARDECAELSAEIGKLRKEHLQTRETLDKERSLLHTTMDDLNNARQLNKALKQLILEAMKR